mmetsp:Transcript_26919/g.81513  ORF Transcript_26919/g.81513 Transcript_26919/m.81513 type:complete len:97 (+) Transcript_26919:286-576(+)
MFRTSKIDECTDDGILAAVHVEYMPIEPKYQCTPSKSCQQRARHEWLLGQRIILVVDYFGGAIAGLSSVVDALLHAVSDRPAMAGILLAPGEFSSL